MKMTDDQLQKLEEYLNQSCSNASLEKFSEDFSKLVHEGTLEAFLTKEFGSEEPEIPLDDLSKITAVRFNDMDEPAVETVVKRIVAAFR